jgi:hypothetical protein
METNKTLNFQVEVRDISTQEPRTLLITGSTESIDRDGDILLSSGWKLGNYLKNPVVLWAHDHSRPPVGTSKAVYVDPRTKQLCFKVYFPTVAELSTPGQPPSEHALFVDTLYNMYKSGMLSASSVGFTGTKSTPRADQGGVPLWQRGQVFTEQELVELSCVSVPANAEALVSARSMKAFDPHGVALVEAAMKSLIEIDESGKAAKGEDMADKLTEEETVKLKAFLAGLHTEKAGRKLSAETIKSLKEIHDHADNCLKCIKGLISSGVEENDDNEAGTETVETGLAPKAAEPASPTKTAPAVSTKAIDLSMSVDEANEILRIAETAKGA